MEPQYLASVHDPLGLLGSGGCDAEEVSDKGHRLVYDSGPNTELNAV